jgi:hypothetical protein
MDRMVASALFALALFVGMLILLHVGRRIGARHLASDPQGARTGTGTIEAAVFALLGLLIAFTFSGAVSRFEARRHLIVEEANAIGTAYLRLDLLPTDSQPALRQEFRRYVEHRLEVFRKLPDPEAAKAELTKATKLQEKIWSQAVAASQAQGAAPAAPMLLLPALNQMIDITTTRTMALQLHPPLIIFGMLFLVALASALLAGYAMAGGKDPKRLHVIGFALVIALTVYVILDIEYPRHGWIRVDAFDQALVNLLKSMK